MQKKLKICLVKNYGYTEVLYNDFFHDSKSYQNARKMLLSKDNISKKFWSLGIL